ncbi:hypothetical protein TIFTF001_027011 [Ficus carica]|uniref:Uncharacterized protein n=1 Tax=Ficus carica TaxID=3494 RepID=A0AA88DM65_FICCA|nr:hypothetical protein TIFTF001_027011 [Ficus carica]
MAIFSMGTGTGTYGDPHRMERAGGIKFGNGDGHRDGDEILFPKISGTGKGKALPAPSPYV